MKESLRDYPSLQMEDDGFLLSLKMDFVDSRKELFGAEENSSFKEMVERLIEGNRAVLDKGSQLPLYVPVFSDDGEMVGSRAVPVWSGVHIDFPLYPGLSKDSVEMFLYWNPRRIGYLGPEFLECDPAFKLALLVHFAIDNISSMSWPSRPSCSASTRKYPSRTSTSRKPGFQKHSSPWLPHPPGCMQRECGCPTVGSAYHTASQRLTDGSSGFAGQNPRKGSFGTAGRR